MTVWRAKLARTRSAKPASPGWNLGGVNSGIPRLRHDSDGSQDIAAAPPLHPSSAQPRLAPQIGRAPCGERVCQSVSTAGVAVHLKKKHNNQQDVKTQTTQK